MSYRILTVLAATILIAGIGFAQQPHPPATKGGTPGPSTQAPTFNVGGDVKDAGGSGISGVMVSSSGVEHTFTDGNGHFLLKGFHFSTPYVVKVSKQQYTFQPDHISIQGGANLQFTGTKVPPKKR